MNWFVLISWVLLNGGANIDKSMSISELIKSNNISGNLKINSNLYKYFAKSLDHHATLVMTIFIKTN